MSRKIVFSKFVPIPPEVDRDMVLDILHNHGDMIELNPYITSYRPIKVPRNSPEEESRDHDWYEVREDTSAWSGNAASDHSSYRACFKDLPNGLDLHIYGPFGIDIKERWVVTSSPTESSERESVVMSPSDLQLRRDCQLNSRKGLSALTEANVYNAHQVFMERLERGLISARHPIRALRRSTGSQIMRPLSYSSRSSSGVASDDAASFRLSNMPAINPLDTHPAFRNQINWSLITQLPNTPTSEDAPRSSSRSSVLMSVPRRMSSIKSRAASRSSSPQPSLPELPQRYKSKPVAEPELTIETAISTFSEMMKPQGLRIRSRLGPEHYVDMIGNPYADELAEEPSSPTDTAPSLTDDNTSDDESLRTSAELQRLSHTTPVTPGVTAAEFDWNKIFEGRSGQHTPALPERAQGHSLEIGVAITPPDLLPKKSVRRRRPAAASRNSSLESYKSTDSAIPAKIQVLDTEEMERRLCLVFDGGFI